MKAKFFTFVRGLMNGTPPRFQSYLKSLTLLLGMVVSMNVWGESTPGTGYTKITSISSLAAGDEVILFCDDNGSGVTGYSGSDATVSTTSSEWIKFVVEKSESNYYFKDPSSKKYITKQTGNKFTITAETASGNECTVDNNGVLCINSRYLCKNSNYYRMYASVGSYKGVFVYKVPSATPTEKYTVTIKDGSDNTLSTLTESAAGAGVTLPNQTTTCEDWTFLGYSETKFASETQDPTTEPTIIAQGSYSPTKNITLYPLFKKTESSGGSPASYQIIFEKGNSDSGSGAPVIQSGSDYASLSSSYAYQRTNGMHLSSGSNAGNATLTLTNAGKVKASSIVTNALAKADKSFKITVTYTDATTAEQSFTPGTTSKDNTITLDDTKTISTIYYSASKGTGTGIASTTVNYTNSVTHNFYITTPSCAAPRVLDYIEVTGTPATFWKGDEFNHTGMTVKAYYTEGDPDDVTGSATYSGYDMSVAGEQTVTVTYNSKTDTYKINVKTIANTQATAYTATEAIAKYKAGKDLSSFVYVKGIVSKIVTEFSSNFGNISFNVSADGETTSTQFQFYRNFKGADKAKWASADEAPQVGDEVIGYGTLTAFGETYEFAEGNYIVSLTRPKKLTSITVSGTPDYFDTQSSFNHNGMTVTAHYNTGASDDAVVTESAEFTAPDMTTTGEKTVNVSYTENGIKKEASYKIQVAQYCANVVTITKGDEENGTFSLSQTGNICADGGLTISVTDIVPAEHYHFKEITATNGNVDNTNKQVTDIDANSTIAVVFEEDTKYELKWMVSGEQMGETQSLFEGDDVTAPTGTVTVPEACANEGKVFVGWTADENVDPETAPTFFAPHKMGAANETYYAVFANVEAGGTEDALMITLDMSDPSWGFPTDYEFGSTQYTNAQGYTIEIMGTNTSSGKGYKAMTDEEGNPKALIMGKTNAYLQLPQFDFAVSKIVCEHNDGQVSGNVTWNVYAGDNAASTSVTGCASDAVFVINQAYQNSQLKIKVTNGNNTQFKNIQIYSKISYSDYVTSCVVPTFSVTIQSNNTTMGSVTVNPEITEDAYAAGTEFLVEATAEEGYRFINWTISDNNEGASLTCAVTETENIFTTGAANVTLTANFEAIPADPITVTLEVGEHGTLECDDCQGNTITEETAGEGVLVPNVIANEGWAFLGWSTSSSATEAEYEYAAIFYPSDDNKTLYAIYAQLYKVTLKYTDEVKWQTTAGGAITLPSRDCKNETYKGHFAGWSITEFAEETTNPTETPTIYPVGDFVPTADITLYPVFSVSTMGGTKWVKTTGDKVTEGIYAIITADGHAFNGTISSGHGQVTTDAFAFTNDVATSAPSGTCEITMQSVTGGFKMYNADKGYLYAKEASSGKLAWDTQGTTATYWNWASENWMYAGVTNARIRDYSNSSIRTYGANNGAVIQFAKKESVAENKYWSKPANDVTNPELDTPAGDYLSPLTVKITSESYDKDLMYYYTTDGSTPAADAELNPTGTSAIYEPTTGIVLQPAQTFNLQVIGYDEDGYTSQIASATYVLYPVFNSISAMYAGATNDKPVGLVLTNAYVHAVNTIGQNSQIFVQQGDLGVVLSVTTANIPEGVEAGKQISGTATGKYTINNGRPQISQFAFQSTFTVEDGSRPEPIAITQTTADLVNTNLLGLVKLEGVYAQSDASNIIVVTEKTDGTGKSSNVYDFFNKVSTIPASDVKCNVIGLFNERKDGSNPIVYSIMPILDNDFDVVEKQNATLPEVNPAGGASEGEALPVANEEIITITPAAGFTTSYKINDAAEWTPITTQKVQPTITEENTKIEVKATRPYYNDASATYYYHIDAGLTKYPITLPSPQTYVKTETDLASAKAGDKVTITISQIVARYWETSVTVVKTNEEIVPTDVTSEGEHKYSFIMPAYPVTIKVNYADAPKVEISYNKGGTGIEGEMSKESAYIGDEYTLTDCAFHAAGLTFAGWKAYKTGDKNTPVTITDNKITVPDYNVSVEAQWDEAAWRKEGTWELIEDASDLSVGDYVILASSVNTTAIGTFNVPDNGKSYYSPVDVTKSDDKKKITDRKTALVMHVEAGTKENTFAFRIEDNSKYIAAISSADNIIGNIDTKTDEASWSVTNKEAGVSYSIVAQGTYTRNLLKEYTSGTTRISCYQASSSGVAELAIYKFYPKAWTVTFDDNVVDEEIAVPKMQRADPITHKVTISTDVPVRIGYDFSIWNSAKGGTGVTSANPGDEITLSANTTLYAQWNIKQYNVAVAEVENVTIQAKPHSEEAIVEGANADVNFKKSVVLSYTDLDDAYVFKSWKVTKAGDETTEVPVSVGSSTTFEVPAYAVKVSAVIESKATTQLTVTYHANGGKNKTAEGPEEVSEQVNWNTTIKFAEHPCPFEKNLCTFVGWNTKEDGTGTTYKTQVTVKTDIDLYAMWQASAVEYVLDENETTKVKVQEGVAPAGSAATFVTTYTGTFGQLTKNNSGTLTLTGYAGKVITGVKMQMKSNASSGAGTIVIKVGDKEICSTSYAESFGSHSSSYSVAELQNFNAAIIGETENITIVVSCTDNSLYIKGYTVEYTDPEIIRNELAVEQYTTFCWPKTIPANAYTGATFWNIEDKTTMADGRLSSITIVKHEGDLEAGVPYIMYNETTELKVYQTGDVVEEPAPENAANGLVGVFETTMFDDVFGTVANDAKAAERGIYIISDGTLYLCGNNCGVYANRAYILNSAIEDKSAMTPPAAPRRVIGNPNGTPTTLNGLFGNKTIKAQKALIDGHIYILRDNKMYNAQGLFVK